MTIKQYLAEPTKIISSAQILEIIESETTMLRLDRTIFHPQGGGQKADKGRIGDAVVTHVVHNDNNVDHYVENSTGLAVGAEVTLEVDQDHRWLNAAYHTAGHLLAAVVETIYPELRAVSGHQWPNEARVEFVGDKLSSQICIEDINTILARDLTFNLPVTIEGDPYFDRTIKIGNYLPIACGGTHVSNLSEINAIHCTTVKSKNGRIRISFEVIIALG